MSARVRTGGGRGWAPEAGQEVAWILRYVCAQPWLLRGRDDDAMAAVRRNREVIEQTLGGLGWGLVVERDMVRLRKSPPTRRDAGSTFGLRARTCSWFFVLLAAAEGSAPRVALSTLIVAARAAAAEAGIEATGDIAERRAIVAALRLLAERGLVEDLDGDVEGFVNDENAPVLLAIHHSRLVHAIVNFPPVDPVGDPHSWLDRAEHEPDPSRRMRRRLIDDAVVHSADLDDAEAAWLSRRVRADDGQPLAETFGLDLERRAEGAAFVVGDEAFHRQAQLGPLAFPAPGTVSHAALVLCDILSEEGHVSGAPGPGWRGMSHANVLEKLAGAASQQAQGRGGWSREYAEHPEVLADAVARLLGGLDLLRRAADDDGTWWFSPVTGRWRRDDHLSRT